ncbi:MAG: hypothetical protein V2I33_23955, partial [Kangiellaceae bacterium]|nr:hypothetical protein [Kangiellaceae bacterium]
FQKSWAENEINPSADEVQNTAWLKRSEAEAFVRDEGTKVAPWFRDLILKTDLMQHWENIEKG